MSSCQFNTPCSKSSKDFHLNDLEFYRTTDKDKENKYMVGESFSHFSNSEEGNESKKTFENSNAVIQNQVLQNKFTFCFQELLNNLEVQENDIDSSSKVAKDFYQNRSNFTGNSNFKTRSIARSLSPNSKEMKTENGNKINDNIEELKKTNYKMNDIYASVANFYTDSFNALSFLSGELGTGESSVHSNQNEATALFNMTDDMKNEFFSMESHLHYLSPAEADDREPEMQYYPMQTETEFGLCRNIPTATGMITCLPFSTVENMHSMNIPDTVPYSDDSFDVPTYDTQNISDASMDLNLHSGRNNLQQQNIIQSLNAADVRKNDDQRVPQTILNVISLSVDEHGDYLKAPAYVHSNMLRSSMDFTLFSENRLRQQVHEVNETQSRNIIQVIEKKSPSKSSFNVSNLQTVYSRKRETSEQSNFNLFSLSNDTKTACSPVESNLHDASSLDADDNGSKMQFNEAQMETKFGSSMFKNVSTSFPLPTIRNTYSQIMADAVAYVVDLFKENKSVRQNILEGFTDFNSFSDRNNLQEMKKANKNKSIYEFVKKDNRFLKSCIDLSTLPTEEGRRHENYNKSIIRSESQNSFPGILYEESHLRENYQHTLYNQHFTEFGFNNHFTMDDKIGNFNLSSYHKTKISENFCVGKEKSKINFENSEFLECRAASDIVYDCLPTAPLMSKCSLSLNLQASLGYASCNQNSSSKSSVMMPVSTPTSTNKEAFQSVCLTKISNESSNTSCLKQISSRNVLSSSQRKILSDFIQSSPYPTESEYKYLSNLLCLNRRVISHWFCNARYRGLGLNKIKRKNVQKTSEQLDYLCSQYLIKKYPSKETIDTISQRVGLEKKIVKRWFYNRRYTESKSKN